MQRRSMMTLPEFIDLAITLQFVEKGRSWDGVDCWGIPVLAFREVLGVSLPEHTDGYASTRRLRELNTLIDTNKHGIWIAVDEPKPMDCVLLRIRGVASHVGLIVDDLGNFIHVEDKCMAIIENVQDRAWQGPGYSKIEGFYRHVSQV